MHDTTIIVNKLLQIRKRLIKDEMNIYTNLVYIFTYRIVFIILILLSYHVLYISQPVVRTCLHVHNYV